MHWFVSTPVISTVSAWTPRRTTSRFVLKNALRRTFSTIQSSGATSKLVVDLVAPGAPAQAAVAQERAQLHERPAVLDAARAVPRPDHGHAARPGTRRRAAASARSRAACARCRSRSSRTSPPGAGSRAGRRSRRARCGRARDPSGRVRRRVVTRAACRFCRIVDRLRHHDRGTRLAEDVDRELASRARRARPAGTRARCSARRRGRSRRRRRSRSACRPRAPARSRAGRRRPSRRSGRRACARRPRSRWRSSASRPTNSPLSKATNRSSPASSGVQSADMSTPQSRYAFSSRSESSAR